MEFWDKTPRSYFQSFMASIEEFITYGIIGVIKEWLEKKPLLDVCEIVGFADKVINTSIEAIKD